MTSSTQEPVRSTKTYSWRSAIRGNVLMIGLVSLFTDFSSEMIYPLLGFFFSGLTGGVESAAVCVGIMSGLAETTSSVLKIFSGRISDRLGKRKLLVAIGYGISALARPVMGLATTGWHVVALRVGDRVGKGIRTAPRDALLSDAVGADVRGLAFSFHRAMDHAGAILGPVVGVGILYLMLGHGLWKGTAGVATAKEMHALRWLFGIAFIPGVLAMVTILAKVKEIRPGRPGGAGKSPADRASSPKLGRRFYGFIAAVSLFSLGNSDDLFLVLYAKAIFPHWGLVHMIGLWVVLHVAKIVFSLPGGIISDKLGRGPVLIAGWITYALVYLGMAMLGATWQLWVLIVLYGFYYGMTEGVEKALVADFVPSAHRGRAYGIYHGAEGLAKLPASLMFGVFWYVIGATVAFSIGAALAAAAVIWLAVLLWTTSRAARTS